MIGKKKYWLITYTTYDDISDDNETRNQVIAVHPADWLKRVTGPHAVNTVVLIHTIEIDEKQYLKLKDNL